MKIFGNNKKDEELKKVLQEVREQFKQTVISFPQRDPSGFIWGDPNYPGNCSGKVPLGFIDKLGAKSVCEVFSGSGTLSDVCRDYEIPYTGIDLNPNKIRDDIYQMNILDFDKELPDGFYGSDMCFIHPPYPGINRVKYSGNAWKDFQGLSKYDIQNYDFERGMEMVNLSIMRAYSALPTGSFLVVLVGEIRANGNYYSMMQNLYVPEGHFQTYVKLQHNTWSGRQTYSGGKNQRALTGHEMIMVCKKPSGYEIAYLMPIKRKLDIRNSVMATWKDVVSAVMRNLGGSANLTQIYSEIEGHDKARKNPHWREKVRQTLKYGNFRNTGRGEWEMVA